MSLLTTVGKARLLVLAVTAALVVGSAEAANATSIDTCPAANWQNLPIVKVRTPYATLSALTNSPNMDKGINYVKETIVPKAGANAFFLVLAILLLLAFILWRTLRYCCFMCCCKRTCDAKRAQRDAHELLFGRGMFVLKVFMYLFGIVAICLAIYGMSKVDKVLVSKAWTVVDGISTYTLNLTGTLDNLLGNISNATLIVDDFQKIVNVTMDITGMQANLTAATSFVAAVPNPNTMKTQLGVARGDLQALQTSLAALQPLVVAMDATHLPNIKTALNALTAAVTTLGTYKSQVDNLSTRIGNLPNSDPGIADTRYTTFSSAVDAADAGVNGGWISSIDTWLSAVSMLQSHQGASNTKFTPLSNAVVDMQTKSAAVGTSVPALSSSINTLITQNTTGYPALSTLLVQLGTVNTSVLVLNADMQSAYDLLSTTVTRLADVGGLAPAPSTLATNLGTLNTALAAPATSGALKTASDAARTALDSHTADLSTTATNLNNLKTSLGTAFQNAFNQMKASRTAYAGTPGAGTWTTMYNDANTLSPQLAGISTAMGTSASQITGMNLGATYTTVNGVTSAMLTSQQTYTTAGGAAITAMLPNLASGGSYDVALGSMGSAYTALGSPATSVFDSPKAVLDSVYAAAIINGNSVKQQIRNTVSSFQGSTGSVKSAINDNINKYQNDYKSSSETYDGYRYKASMALYGLSILFILLLFVCYAVNYHFGASFAAFCLLVICVLYFLLAFISALALIGLSDVCPNIEPIVVDKVPSNVLPVVRYYFYNDGNSLKTVLNGSGLVDVDAIMAQVTTSKTTVINSISGNYTLRAAPLAVLAKVNTTFDAVTANVDALLAAASYAPVNALYRSVKSLFCCTFPDEFGYMWQGLTFAGVMALAMLVCTFFYIGRIDRAPRIDCCGCTFHTRARYAATIGVQGPTYALPLYGSPYNSQSYGGSAPYQAPNLQSMGSGGYGGVSVHVQIGNGKRKEAKEGREGKVVSRSSSGNAAGLVAAGSAAGGASGNARLYGSGRHSLNTHAPASDRRRSGSGRLGSTGQ